MEISPPALLHFLNSSQLLSTIHNPSQPLSTILRSQLANSTHSFYILSIKPRMVWKKLPISIWLSSAKRFRTL